MAQAAKLPKDIDPALKAQLLTRMRALQGRIDELVKVEKERAAAIASGTAGAIGGASRGTASVAPGNTTPGGTPSGGASVTVTPTCT